MLGIWAIIHVDQIAVFGGEQPSFLTTSKKETVNGTKSFITIPDLHRIVLRTKLRSNFTRFLGITNF